MASKEALHHGDAAEIAAAGNRGRMSRIAKEFIKWGVGSGVVAAGILLATHFIVPVIPVAAATKAALVKYGHAGGKWLAAMGGIFLGLGAGKAAFDVARRRKE